MIKARKVSQMLTLRTLLGECYRISIAKPAIIKRLIRGGDLFLRCDEILSDTLKENRVKYFQRVFVSRGP